MKKIIITAVVCAVTAYSVIAIPDMMIESIPTAKSVTLKKIEHTEQLELTGNIVKSAANDGMYVRAYASEKDISMLHIGQQAEIKGDGFPTCVYDGEISYISEYATVKQVGNTAQTVVEVKIDIINPDDNLKAGFTAETTIKLSEPHTMTVVPYEALEQDEKGEFVYILRNNKAEKCYVKTGKELSEGVEILLGLTEDSYVIEPTEECQEGAPVFIEE